jgi:GLPGLI family protein
MKQFLFLALLLLPGIAGAQLVESGRIEYERKSNIHRQMEGNEWFDKMKAQIPKFVTTYHDLIFAAGKTYYKPGKEVEANNMLRMFGGSPAAENRVYTDISTKRVTASKPVFEEKFLVMDSMRKMRWKISDEVRTIAGFKCRKAVSIMCDSVYVVAFYTEEIPVSGGPEMFGNLPGMILELAIPRLYTTYIATKVETVVPKAEEFIIPDKGKKVTQKELIQTITSSTKQWGEFAARSIWWSSL